MFKRVRRIHSFIADKISHFLVQNLNNPMLLLSTFTDKDSISLFWNNFLMSTEYEKV